MKKLFLLTFLAIILMLRVATGVRVTGIFQKEVYREKNNKIVLRVRGE